MAIGARKRTGPGALIQLTVATRKAPAGAAARVLRTAARAFCEQLRLQGRELSITLVTDRAIHALNRDWRGKDKPTDVLSFPQDGAHGPLGDVVISLDTAVRQAKEGGWPLPVELRRLLAHGLLHCLGYDHEEPADSSRMARAEEKLLGRRGMVGDAFTTAAGHASRATSRKPRAASRKPGSALSRRPRVQ